MRPIPACVTISISYSVLQATSITRHRSLSLGTFPLSFPRAAGGFKFVSAIPSGILVLVCVGRILTNETSISRKPCICTQNYSDLLLPPVHGFWMLPGCGSFAWILAPMKSVWNTEHRTSNAETLKGGSNGVLDRLGMHPRGAVRAAEQLIGFVITDDLSLLRVPGEAAAEFHG